MGFAAAWLGAAAAAASVFFGGFEEDVGGRGEHVGAYAEGGRCRACHRVPAVVFDENRIGAVTGCVSSVDVENGGPRKALTA